MNMPFGKYKGWRLCDIPHGYLLWVIDNLTDLSPTLESAICDVLGIHDATDYASAAPNGPPISDAAKLVRSWHHTMTRKYHPDRGGTHEQMLVVNEGAELLKQILNL